ncbi:MAG: TMEM165/GDT1 family protein [Rhodoferax sp.]
MQSLFVSTGVVALAEIGDKTQLLALLLAVRFKKPWPIVAGIVVATVFNHGLAGALGGWITAQLPAQGLRWALGLGFVAMALWTLVPDTVEDGAAPAEASRLGVFGTTVLAFFLAEMGDKTQVATVALAAHYAQPLAVVAGTTAGMLLADVPAVFLGERLAQRVPMRWVRALAAGVFMLLGLSTLWSARLLSNI